MKKVGIALGVLLALVAVAAAVLPWYLGVEAEKRFQEGLAEYGSANSPFAVKLVRYERGWFESTALHRVSVKADPTIYFDVHHAIDHLPDPRVGFHTQRAQTPRQPVCAGVQLPVAQLVVFLNHGHGVRTEPSLRFEQFVNTLTLRVLGLSGVPFHQRLLTF